MSKARYEEATFFECGWPSVTSDMLNCCGIATLCDTPKGGYFNGRHSATPHFSQHNSPSEGKSFEIEPLSKSPEHPPAPPSPPSASDAVGSPGESGWHATPPQRNPIMTESWYFASPEDVMERREFLKAGTAAGLMSS